MTKRIIGLFLALVLIFSNGIISYAGSENEAKITSPANNSWLDPYQTITVKWTAPAAGMTCKITILNERTGAYLTRNEKVSGTSYSIKSNTLDFEEKYKIWVGTFNGSEAIGGGSVIYIRMNDRLNSQKVYPEADFTSPKNNQEVSADSNLKITWNGNNDLAYQLSIKDLTTGMNIVDESSLTQTSYTISANKLEAGHSYKAWIGTYKKASYEKKLFSSGKNIEFKTAKATTTTGGSSTPPQRPTVTTPPTSDRPEVDLTGNPARINNPSNQAWVDPNQPIKVIWTVLATGLSCRLSIQNDVTGEYIVKNYEPSSNYYTISKNTLVEEQRYKITLTTYRDNTKIGESSEIYINTNNVDYPEATYSFPSAGAVINTTEKLTLRFSNMNSDLCYRISIVDTSDNSAILRNKLVSGSSYTLNANTLEPGKQYKLWIGTYLNANTENALGSGEIIFINTANNQEEPQDATVQAYFTSPENNEVIDKDLGVTLKWSSSDKPTYYELTVKDETNGTYLVQNKLLTNTSYTIKSSELSKRHSYKAWVGTYSNKTSDKKLLGSGSELYFSTDGNLPALVTSLTADMKNDGLVFSYELTGDNLKHADILVKDSNEKIFYHEKVYQTTGQIVIPTADLKENTTYICEIQTYDTNDMKAAYKSQKYEVAKSGFSISNDAKKPSGDLPHKKGFTVKGTVTSAHPISEAKIVIFSRGNETDIHDIVHLTNYDKTADPNNKFNIYSYDSQVNFGSLQPGEYTYRVSVVDIMGNTYTAVETNFRIVREIGTYDDVSSDHPNYEAIKQLSIDGVLNGDGNGKFRPNASINRGEFVKMMCCAFGLSTSQSASSFRDVAQDYWATPYIMAAFQRKIVNGKGDGIFAPTASVTYEEAAKMLVCVKGWEESALQNGGWQNGGYTFVAEENDFFLKTTVASNQNYKKGATRADVAQMFYNALTTDTNNVVKIDKKDLEITIKAKSPNKSFCYQYDNVSGYDNLFKNCNVIFLKPYQYVALELYDQNGKVVDMKNENLYWKIEGNGIKINEPNTLCSTSTATNADVYLENSAGERISHVRVISFEASNLQPLDFINSETNLNYNNVSLRNISVAKHTNSYDVCFDIYNGWNIPIQVSVYDKNNKLDKSVVVNGVWTEVGVCEGFLDGANATWDVLSLKIFKSDYINENLYNKRKININVPIGGYIALEYPKDGNDAQIACYLGNILRVMLSTKDLIDEIKKQGLNVDKDKLIAELDMDELIQFFRETLGSELTKNTSIEFEKNFKEHIISTFSSAAGQGNFDEMMKELNTKFDSKFINKLLSSLIGEILAPFAEEMVIESINTAIEKTLGLEILFIGTDIIFDNLQMNIITKQLQQAQNLENEKMGYLFTPISKIQHSGSGRSF